MSLLRIAQRIANRVGLPRVQQVIGGTTNNDRQLLEIIQQSGEDLKQMRNSEGDGWSVLNRINQFQTVAGQSEYSLPSDFESFIVQTAWQKDKYWLLRGSLNGRQWEQIRNRLSTTSYNVFRILRTADSTLGSVGNSAAPNLARKFTLEPAAGASGQDLIYEYVSKAWWVSQDGTTFKSEPTDDTDESLFGDTIHVLDGIWQFKQANGFNFAADLARFEIFRDRAFAQDAAKEPIPIGWNDRIYANKDESDVEWCL